jgi:hypothetical protein
VLRTRKHLKFGNFPLMAEQSQSAKDNLLS